MQGEIKDPILAYLLERNKTEPIEYQWRHLIPPGGLQEMLDGYKKFHLNPKEEELPEPKSEPTIEEELYKLLD